MIKNLLIATIALTSLSAFAANKEAKAEKVEADASTSKVVWVGKKVTGQHTGEVKVTNGFLNFEKNALKGGEFEVDMSSITNTDIGDKEMHDKLLGHLSSPDFFNTAEFKTSKLVIKSVKKEKAANTYKVTGDLTIKGKSNSVTFDAVATKEQATGKIVFDRTKYDIKYGSGKFFEGLGDKMINDDVELNITLVAKK